MTNEAVKTAATNDVDHMRAALSLARRGLGNVWPNPAVGCVIVKGDRIVGRGWTQPGGRPHAETEALRRAGNLAEGATAFVSLEPCNHQGQTPPCTEALIKSGVKKIVIGTQDPDVRVAGTGIARLKAAGIEIEFGFLKPECDRVNQGFFSRVEYKQPFVTLKIATTLDGKIALGSGASQWITGESARRFAHRLRANNDAIMVGGGTAVFDNPSLTSRLPGISNERRLRIVLDGTLRLPLDSNLVISANDIPVLVFTSAGNDEKRAKIDRLKTLGVSVKVMENRGLQLDLRSIMNEIASRGVTRLFVEGGATLAASLLKQDMVDQIAWFRAPSMIGDDGLSAIADLGLGDLIEMPKFVRNSFYQIGEDYVEILSRK